MNRKTPRALSRRLVPAAALFSAVIAALPLCPAGAITARYGVTQSPVGTYRYDMPPSARRIYLAGRLYFLYEAVYYQPVMVQGRVAYLAVETTWQR